MQKNDSLETKAKRYRFDFTQPESADRVHKIALTKSWFKATIEKAPTAKPLVAVLLQTVINL
jgi:hypothetical protein